MEDGLRDARLLSFTGVVLSVISAHTFGLEVDAICIRYRANVEPDAEPMILVSDVTVLRVRGARINVFGGIEVA